MIPDTPATSDWAALRGDKWRDQLAPMEATLAPVDAPLIRALQLDAPYRIADIGCGGGGTSLQLLQSAPRGSVVHGFDISPALIAVAHNRAPAGETAIAFRVADMTTAPAPEVRYDRLVSRFGIMFFDDAPAAFHNIVGWLVPGGRFAFAAWSNSDDNPWLTTVRDVVADIVTIPKVDRDAPGPFRYADAGVLVALLENSGMRDVEVHDWRGALSIGGRLPAAPAADFALAAFSSFSELLTDAGESAMNAARTALTAKFSRHESDAVVSLGARVNIVTGTRA